MKRVLALASAALVICGTANANIISLFETQRNTDFVSAGIGGLRGTGTGVISLSGVSGTVNRVYLYWHGPTNSSDPNFNATITFNGVQVSGENIGFSDDNFWNQDNSQAYRADVTALVSGDGAYTLAGLPPSNANGASLLAFFDDGNDANNRDIVLFDGNDANFSNAFDPTGWDILLENVDYTGGDVALELHVSDGQNFSANDDSNLFLNGTLLASGGIFQGDSTPFNPSTNVRNGSLWDIENFDITSFLVLGLNNLNITMAPANDAVSAIVAAISLPPAGAALQDPPEIPAPTALFLFLTGAGALGGLSRRRMKQAARAGRFCSQE